jgi:hypothetical protein
MMHGDKGERARRAKITRELDAARLAHDRGRRSDLIYHLRVAEALCVQDELDEPPPSPRGVLLTINDVMKITGYSKTRLRHMGHLLAGYWKSPTGKVGWYSGPLEASLAGGGRPRRSSR